MYIKDFKEDALEEFEITPIEEMELNGRVLIKLKREDINTVGELCHFTIRSLQNYVFTRKELFRILAELDEHYGIWLPDDEDCDTLRNEDKCFCETADRFCTDTEAIIFTGSFCEPFDDHREWNTAALIVTPEDVWYLPMKCKNQDSVVEALQNTVINALGRCRDEKIESAVIFYSMKKDETRTYIWQTEEKSDYEIEAEEKIKEACKEFPGIRTQSYHYDITDIRERPVVDNILWKDGGKELSQISLVEAGLVLARGLARRGGEDFDYEDNINICAMRLCHYKKEVLFSRKPEYMDRVKDGEMWYDSNFNIIRAKKKKYKLDLSIFDRHSLIRFILETAGSIGEENMSVYHLIYAYAKIALMDEYTLAKRLCANRDRLKSIIFFRNRILKYMTSNPYMMDLNAVVELIPKEIDKYQNSSIAQMGWDNAMKLILQYNGDKRPEEQTAFNILTDIFAKEELQPELLYFWKSESSYERKEKKKKEEDNNNYNKTISMQEILRDSSRLLRELKGKIKGQDTAVEQFVSAYSNAGLECELIKDRPMAFCLFAGPPGVGKSFMARTAGEILNMPVKIFDMSAYTGSNAHQGLVGFEETWKDSGEGVLTSYVMRNPRSIIVIDEIEKASKEVQMLFLQMLDGGRLFDKYHKKDVSFAQSILIFTTNCGKRLYEDNEDQDISEIKQGEVLNALRMDEDFPMELCSRFAAGNIIVFRHLHPAKLRDIAESSMQSVAEMIEKRFKIKVQTCKYLPEFFLFQYGGNADARIVTEKSRSLLKEHIMTLMQQNYEKDEEQKIESVSIELDTDPADGRYEDEELIWERLKQCKRERQSLFFVVEYLCEGSHARIIYKNLRLEAAGDDDPELRRLAKQTQLFDFERPTLRFDDIIGADTAKEECRHFIRYMRDTGKYVRLKATVPKGIILYGPPGTGKTSMAKALAGESGAFFLNTTGVNILRAQDAVKEIKNLFRIAEAHAPSILFIDEFDVIATERSSGSKYLQAIVNTFLTEMDGFKERNPLKPVFVVAATNFNMERTSYGETIIDPALVRRFDREIYIGYPDHKARKLYLKKIIAERDYDKSISEEMIELAVEQTGGASLDFLRKVVSNMTNVSIDRDLPISDELFSESLESMLYGERRDIGEENRERVAYHEAGHAYVAWKLGYNPQLITIVSRGDIGGFVHYGDGEDQLRKTRKNYLDIICKALAGRASEMLRYGERGINDGASSDLNKATNMAKKMIFSLGMGKNSLIAMDPEELLKSAKGDELMSEIEQILDEQFKRATDMLSQARGTVDKLVEILLDQSYIQKEQLISIFEGCEQAAGHNKCYVVVNGRNPGIYKTWKECEEQVKGYSNAVYRSFTSRAEADEFMRSSRTGASNIKSRKLLYHMIKLDDLLGAVKEGVDPVFEFHAYSKEMVENQRKAPEETYIQLCITRDQAVSMDMQIRIGDSLYPYEEGFERVDWKALEDNTGDAVSCVSEERLPFKEIRYIYVPDEESARKVRQLAGNEVVGVHVNRKMFV